MNIKFLYLIIQAETVESGDSEAFFNKQKNGKWMLIKLCLILICLPYFFIDVFDSKL